MRIAFDYQIFKLQSYGGISRYFAQLAQGLLEMEQQVGVFAPLHCNNYLAALPQEIIYGRHINRYPPKTGRFISTYNYLRSCGQIARWKPDVVHETYFTRFSLAPKGCATVVTVYDMIRELFPDEFPIHERTNQRKAIMRADHVICISENTKKDLMRFYGTSDTKITVVHLGVDREVVHKSPTSLLTDKPFLLFVGTRGGYKNFTGFLKAMASSKRLLTDFDIIAFGGPKFTSEELSLISSLGFAENQVQYKSGGDDSLGRFYNSARAFVYPSLYEGFGIPPLEAMAHHCPVISSNTSSMPEVIADAGEYFDPADTDDIRRAIEATVYSNNRIEDLRKLGLERLAAFSWKKCTQDTFNVYNLIV